MLLFNKIFKKNSRPVEVGNFFSKVTSIVGFKPINIKYFEKAFTHRSSSRIDESGNPFNYERLEFLGDSMLSFVISAHLYKEAPLGDEGYLTKMRSKIVSREHLNNLGKELNLVELVDSKVPPTQFGENIHGNLFEALVGAIFLDQGYHGCEKFIYDKVIIPYVNIEKLEGKVISYKSIIIEWCQKEKKQFYFDSYDDCPTDGQRYFGAKLFIDSKQISKSRATSKKKAEELAAKRAFYALQDKINNK